MLFFKHLLHLTIHLACYYVHCSCSTFLPYYNITFYFILQSKTNLDTIFRCYNVIEKLFRNNTICSNHNSINDEIFYIIMSQHYNVNIRCHWSFWHRLYFVQQINEPFILADEVEEEILIKCHGKIYKTYVLLINMIA